MNFLVTLMPYGDAEQATNNYPILLKKLLISSASNSAVSIAGKCPPTGNSDQCCILKPRSINLLGGNGSS